MLEAKYAVRIHEAGNLVYKYKGIQCEVPLGECPETYIQNIIDTNTKKQHKNKITYFVNSGCDDSHVLMNVEVFYKLKDAKEYFNKIEGYSNQVKQIVRCEYDKFNLVSTKIINGFNNER